MPMTSHSARNHGPNLIRFRAAGSFEIESCSLLAGRNPGLGPVSMESGTCVYRKSRRWGL